MNTEFSASPLRRRVAREAALLLYTMQEKEFKQAKERASRILGLRIMPTNLEVAEELDSIADENEGFERKKRLIYMRKEALEIMKSLREFNPRLIGSVWRGTANKNSDIDIVVFSQNKDLITDILHRKGFKIVRTEYTPTKKDGSDEVLHIFISLPSGDEAEVVVKDLEDMYGEERCEIYGDQKKGLSINQLSKVLKNNPLQRFLPEKR